MHFKKIISFLAILLFTQTLFAKDNDQPLFPMQKNFKWGFINKQGEWVIEPTYNWVTSFHEGVAAVAANDDEWKLIDKSGSQVFDRTFRANMSSITSNKVRIPSGDFPRFSEGLIALPYKGNIACYNKDEELQFTVDCDEAFPFSEGRAKIEQDDTIRYINKKGEIITDQGFEEGRPFSEGLAAVGVFKDDKDKDSGNMGFIDKTGKLVIPAKFKSVGDFSNGRALFQTESKRRKTGYYSLIGFINKKGEVVIEPQIKPFDNHKKFSEGLYGGEIDNGNGNMGYINTEGETAILPKYEDVYPFSEGLAFVVEENDSDDIPYFIDKKGNKVIENELIKQAVYVHPFKNGLSNYFQ